MILLINRTQFHQMIELWIFCVMPKLRWTIKKYLYPKRLVSNQQLLNLDILWDRQLTTHG